jgi:hypothetical protein
MRYRWRRDPATVKRMSTPVIRRWKKSTRTIDNPKDYNCVEVGDGGDVIAVRDTKDRAGTHLHVSRAQWGSFVRAVNADQIS